MAEWVQLHGRIWVRDWNKDNIWTLTTEDNYSTAQTPTKHSHEWHHNLLCPRSLLFHCCVQILQQKIGKIKNILIISKLLPWIVDDTVRFTSLSKDVQLTLVCALHKYMIPLSPNPLKLMFKLVKWQSLLISASHRCFNRWLCKPMWDSVKL